MIWFIYNYVNLFSGLKILKEIKLESNQLNKINGNEFRHLNNLIHIFFIKQHFKNIRYFFRIQ